MSSSQLLELLDCFKEVNYKKDQLIIEKGSIGDKFYIIKRGSVRIYDEDKKNKFSKNCYRGDFFGETAIISDGHRLANVRANTPVSLLEISKHDFLWAFDYQ